MSMNTADELSILPGIAVALIGTVGCTSRLGGGTKAIALRKFSNLVSRPRAGFLHAFWGHLSATTENAKAGVHGLLPTDQPFETSDSPAPLPKLGWVLWLPVLCALAGMGVPVQAQEQRPLPADCFSGRFVYEFPGDESTYDYTIGSGNISLEVTARLTESGRLIVEHLDGDPFDSYIEIFDVQGRLVAEDDNSGEVLRYRLETGDLAPGDYCVSMSEFNLRAAPPSGWSGVQLIDFVPEAASLLPSDIISLDGSLGINESVGSVDLELRLSETLPGALEVRLRVEEWFDGPLENFNTEEGTDFRAARRVEDFDDSADGTTVVIEAGQSAVPLSIGINDDRVAEPDESFFFGITYCDVPGAGAPIEGCSTLFDGGVGIVIFDDDDIAPPVNRMPTLTGTPSPNARPGDDYRFAPTASDPDGDTLLFSIAGRPAWASFDRASGVLSGRPTTADAGLYEGIVITVDDQRGTDVSRASVGPFSIRIGLETMEGESVITPPGGEPPVDPIAILRGGGGGGGGGASGGLLLGTLLSLLAARRRREAGAPTVDDREVAETANAERITVICSDKAVPATGIETT